jgi:hypothetical protein
MVIISEIGTSPPVISPAAVLVDCGVPSTACTCGARARIAQA